MITKRFLCLIAVFSLLFTIPTSATETEDEETSGIGYCEEFTVEYASSVTIHFESDGEVLCYIDDVEIPQYSAIASYFKCKVPYGQHKMYLLSDGTYLTYNISIDSIDTEPYLMYSSLTTILGFNTGNYVVNPNAAIKYRSSDKSVFTVKADGTVVPTGVGKATLKAYCGEQLLECPVTVLENKYKRNCISGATVKSNSTAIQVKSVKYVGKKLYVTCCSYNNTAYKAKLKSASITLTSDGTTVLDELTLKKAVAIPAFTHRDFTLVVPAKYVPKELLNLCDGNVYVTATYSYKKSKSSSTITIEGHI